MRLAAVTVRGGPLFTETPLELSRWRGGRCADAQIEAGVPPRSGVTGKRVAFHLAA
jgi:hypothetical protein